MEEFNIFASIVQKSAKKHGPETPLTLGHLANIIKMASKIKDQRDLDMQAAMDEVWEDQHRYGHDSDDGDSMFPG